MQKLTTKQQREAINKIKNEKHTQFDTKWDLWNVKSVWVLMANYKKRNGVTYCTRYMIDSLARVTVG